MRKTPPWTPEETALARQLYRPDVSPMEFRQRVGRTKQAAKCRIKYLDNPIYRQKKTDFKRGQRMERRRHWTDTETDIARQLLADDATDAVFWETIGRSKASAVERMFRIRDGRITGKRVLPRADNSAIPRHVIADAVKRASEPRSLTAMLMGDPVPSRTALAKRMEMA